MPTGIEGLWKGLESSPGVGDSSTFGWAMRLALPEPSFSLFAAIEVATGRRSLLLKVSQAMVPPRRHWARCKGLEYVSFSDSSSAFWGVSLNEARFSDVFAALADDVIRRIRTIPESAEQAKVFLGQIAKWQKFLSAVREGISSEQQRGLWGELFLLERYLLPALGTASAKGWKGGEGAEQDFQFSVGAIEVKTTLARQPQIVRIASEKQLDDSTWPRLFLVVLALDVREAAPGTLPAMVASLRATLAGDLESRESFEDTLLAAGYLDTHAERYLEVGYLVRSEKFFHVTPGFPRIVERELQPGVGGVGYGLAVSACEQFSIPVETVLVTFAKGY